MKDQIFKAVFGSDWERLPIVFQKRYMHHPYSNDQFTVEGTMDIYLSKWMLFFAPIFKLFRTLVPYQGKAVPVVVNFHSQTDSDGVYLDRTFYFPGKKPYSFNSCMRVIKGNDVVERMSLGLGWRSHYFYDGKKIVMQHKSFVWMPFGLMIPLPVEFFLGKGYAEEVMIDDNSYRISMTMTHPWFGLMYSYAGDFSFKR